MMNTKTKVAGMKAMGYQDINVPAAKVEEVKSEARKLAELKLSTSVLNAVTSSKFIGGSKDIVEFKELEAVMREKVSKVNVGDLTDLESTLTTQAVSLDVVYNTLAMRAIQSDTLSNLESYLRLALKAQAQCARTIEVLAAMKSPPIVFAKQANIANGNQQINNGNLPNSLPTHAGKNINQSNELLEVNNGSETMDIGATKTAIRVSKKLATLEAQHRG